MQPYAGDGTQWLAEQHMPMGKLVMSCAHTCTCTFALHATSNTCTFAPRVTNKHGHTAGCTDFCQNPFVMLLCLYISSQDPISVQSLGFFAGRSLSFMHVQLPCSNRTHENASDNSYFHVCTVSLLLDGRQPICKTSKLLIPSWVAKVGVTSNADDDSLTAQTSTSSQHQHNEASVQAQQTQQAQQAQQTHQAQQTQQAGPDQSSVLLHRQAWDESMLPRPLSWREGNKHHPEVALHQAKQDFAQWLSGAHAHPDYVEHMQQLAAASQAAAWPNTGYQSGAGMHPQDKELQQQAAADQAAADQEATPLNAGNQDTSETRHVAAQPEHPASKSSTALSTDRHQGYQDSNGVNTRSLGNPIMQQAGLNAGIAAGVYEGYLGSKGNEIDQLQQQVVANSGMPAKTYAGYKDGNGFAYIDQMSARQGSLQHASLGS